ncbi:MAG: hypothetical protein GY856_08590, partial [bacterium]|nr:hypothetical protein [bacterium]
LGNTYSGPWAGWLYQRFIQGPLDAGTTPAPAVFFGGVMLMGVVATIGLAFYARFVAPSAQDDAA